MRAMKWLLILLLIAAALTSGYYLGSRQHLGHDQPGEIAAEKATKQQWTCGMHPFIIRDEPGLCPICHMELTPVKAGTSGSADVASASGDGGIAIDPVTTQNMGIRSEVVSNRRLSRTLRTVGLITYEEGRKYSVNSKIEGWIEKLYVNREGQEVKPGQPLLAIYSPELVAAQEEFLLALSNGRRLAASPVPEVGESAKRLLTAARTRLQYWDISAEQITALETSGQPSKTLTLYSRHSGVVISKKALEGMRVMAGEELLQIGDVSRLWINAEIFEYELPWVAVGQEAEIELPYAPDKVERGKITHIYPYLRNETRTATARIEVDNPGLALKPEMYATIRIRAKAVTSLAIPADAVLNSGQVRTVFVVQEGGKFEPRPVILGVSGEDGYVQVKEGLQEGERVVVSAQFLLDSESSLREALRKMSGAGMSEAPAAPGGDQLDDLFK